jgi:hypothetical protein
MTTPFSGSAVIPSLVVCPTWGRGQSGMYVVWYVDVLGGCLSQGSKLPLWLLVLASIPHMLYPSLGLAGR